MYGGGNMGEREWRGQRVKQTNSGLRPIYCKGRPTSCLRLPSSKQPSILKVWWQIIRW